MNRSELENGMNELEARETDDVSNLLGALPRVEAPANFEFGVRARIAARDVSPQANLVPFLKVAAPLSLVLLLAAFVIFNGIVPTSDNAPAVASADPVQSDATVPAARQEPSPQVSGSQVAETVDAPQVTSPVATGEPRRVEPVRRTSRTGSDAVPQDGRDGSVDLAIKPANVILPRGFQSVAQRDRGVNANSADAGREIPIREVFEMLGVKAEFAGGGWTVRSTADNSIAARSGVRSGDVIEAFNDHELTEGTTLKAGFAGKSLRVRREGKQVKLDLKN